MLDKLEKVYDVQGVDMIRKDTGQIQASLTEAAATGYELVNQLEMINERIMQLERMRTTIARVLERKPYRRLFNSSGMVKSEMYDPETGEIS